MSTLGTAWAIARRRVRADLRLTLALLLGVVIAAALLASTTIYARAMADLGLGFAVRDRFGVPPTTRIVTPEQGLPLGTTQAHAVQQSIQQRMQARIGWFTQSYARYIRLSPLDYDKPGAGPALDGRLPALWLQALDGFEQHVRLDSGSFPQPPASATDPIQIAVAKTSANGLVVGDQVSIVDSFDDCERHPPRMNQPPDPPCTPKVSVKRTLPAVVTALVEPLDPNDPLWVNGANGYFSGEALYEGGRKGVAAFLPIAALDGPVGTLFADHWATQQWYAFADLSKLTRENYHRAGNELAALQADVEKAGVFGLSTLPSALQEFDRQLSYDQAPLLILILQIAGIACFYVAIVAAMAVERQQPEIALLRSRGASATQVLLVYAVQGAMLAVPATIAGPFLGALFTKLLGLTPAFHAATGGHLIPVQIGLEAFALALVGALLGVLALLLPAAFAARFSGITFRHLVGRPQVSLIQRYFLDVGLLGLCGVLLWELDARGTVFKPGTSGGLSSDPLLLLAPALLTLALAVLVLRVYPFLLRIAARLVSAGGSITAVQGLRQMTRNPAQYTRLGLLLMMGVAVGAFAASYNDTTNRSLRERALYQTGVDMRGFAQLGASNGTAPEADAAYAAVPGVARASVVLRDQAQVASAGDFHDTVNVLAADPDAARSMLWYRPGLSHDSLDALMSDLGSPTQPIGKAVPGEPVSLSLWANPLTARENLTAWARFRQADGRYEMYELGKLDFTGWRQMTAQLNSVGTRPKFPISLVAIVLTQPASGSGVGAKPVYFDDVSVQQTDGSAATVEDFEGLAGWTAVPQPGGGDAIAFTSEEHHGGARSLRYTFADGVTAPVRGFYVTDANVPLPAVVSRDYARRTGLRVGGASGLQFADHYVPIRVAGIADLFPTLDPAQGPYVLLNRTHLLEWLDRLTDDNSDQVNEVWLKLSANANHDAVARALDNPPFRLDRTTDLASELKLNGADPLIAAGGSGILFVSFVAALVLVAGAYVVSLFSALRRRRVEFAVMSALGLGRGRVFAMLAFEYGTVTLIGAVAGVWLGIGISRIMLSFLDVTATGDKVLPPFVLQTNWSFIAAALAALAAVVAAAIGMAGRSYTTGAQAGVLRNTE